MSQDYEADKELDGQPDHPNREGEHLEPTARVVRAKGVSVRQRAGATDRSIEMFAASAR